MNQQDEDLTILWSVECVTCAGGRLLPQEGICKTCLGTMATVKK